MIRLNPNSGTQAIFLTLQDAARDWQYTNYLFKLVHRMSKEEFFFVGDVVVDNPRYTRIDVATNTDDTNNVLLTDTGYYDYAVYVQNSESNLDPANALAKVEIGTLFVTGTAISNAPSIILTEDIVYYGGQ